MLIIFFAVGLGSLLFNVFVYAVFDDNTCRFKIHVLKILCITVCVNTRTPVFCSNKCAQKNGIAIYCQRRTHEYIFHRLAKWCAYVVVVDYICYM